MSLPTRSGWSPSRENAIRSVERRGTTLQYLGDFRDDEGVVCAAVSCDGRALQFASDRLRDNEATVRTAVLQHADALQYVSERLRTQHTFLLSLSCPKMNLVSKDWQQSPAGLET